MLALVGRPSLHGYDACVVSWTEGDFGEIAGKNNVRPLFLLHVLCVWSEFQGKVLGVNSLVFLDWEGQASWATLTRGDFALEVGVDFPAVAEHRLIPARVRSEVSRLRGKGLAIVWAPACQDSSHVGNAGIGVVSMRGAPLALPTFATDQFKSLFDCGRAARCLLPLGAGMFMHLVVLYGCQGSDTDPEQLA